MSSWTNWDIFHPDGTWFISPDEPGKAFVSNQGEAGTCLRHAIGKGIFDYLKKLGLYVRLSQGELEDKQQEVINQVLAIHPHHCGTSEEEFHRKGIVQDGIKLTMEISRATRKRSDVMSLTSSPEQRQKNTFLPFADHAQRASFLKDSSNFLILGCDVSIFDGRPGRGPQGHAVYVDNYDVETRTFECINSWGPDGRANPRPYILDYHPGFQDYEPEFSVYRVHLVAEGPTRNEFSTASTLPAAPAGEGKHMYSFISRLNPKYSYR